MIVFMIIVTTFMVIATVVMVIKTKDIAIVIIVTVVLSVEIQS